MLVLLAWKRTCYYAIPLANEIIQVRSLCIFLLFCFCMQVLVLFVILPAPSLVVFVLVVKPPFAIPAPSTH